jgi:lipopolysaccharide/colanic/teichoic acid biosynthesis glycosyltransferase
MNSDRLAGEVSKVQDRLAALADQLCDTSSTVLDRRRYPDRDGAEITQMRDSARRMTLEAVMLCAALHAAHGGSVSLPALEKVTRPTRRNPNPSKVPTVAMNVLAHAFTGIYIDFVVLSARITGIAVPRESLLYVREVQNADQNELLDIDTTYGPPPPRRTRLVKNLLDRCVAAVALFALAPLFAALAAVIWLDSGGPVLYIAPRVGKDGRLFKMYKFRTLVVDAEQRRVELLASSDSDGVLFKLRQDPRVTRVGKYLRSLWLDELPELFNVLAGDMSLVGPSPAHPGEVARYTEYVRRRLVVKPGMTGLWQVNGRSDLSWEEVVRLDLQYVENWSFTLDLLILLKTISVLFSREGVY